jgi:hypothetical protein
MSIGRRAAIILKSAESRNEDAGRANAYGTSGNVTPL